MSTTKAKFKIKIEKKMVFTLVLCMIAVIVLVFGIISKANDSLNSMEELLYEKIYITSTEIINADRDFYQASLAETKYMLMPDLSEEDKTAYVSDFNENAAQTYDRVKAALEAIKDDAELYSEYKDTSSGKTMEQLFAAFEADYNSWKNAYNINTGEGDIQLRISSFESARGSINSMTELLETFSTEKSSAISKEASVAILKVLLIGGIIFIVCFVLLVWTVIDTMNAIKYATSVNNKIAEGDFTVTIPDSKKTTDEVGELCIATSNILDRLKNYSAYISEIADTLTLMADGNMKIDLKHSYDGEFSTIKDALINISDSLNRTLSSIKSIAGQVDTGAGQVSSSAQLLSEGATNQASTLQQLAATICEISKGIQQNADNVLNAKDIVETTKNETEQGSAQMEKMIEAVSAISKSSSDISKIIKVIDDIAFQTNILALNASVEAARAGEAGKGFAVVANEVRNLAAKSAEAAKNTSELIADSMQRVEDGTNIANSTSESLKGIVDGINKITSLMENIAHDSETQAQAIVQINDGIEQISDVVQTNSATAEQNAAASEELSGQSRMLTESVSAFTLYEG